MIYKDAIINKKRAYWNAETEQHAEGEDQWHSAAHDNRRLQHRPDVHCAGSNNCDELPGCQPCPEELPQQRQTGQSTNTFIHKFALINNVLSLFLCLTLWSFIIYFIDEFTRMYC